MLFPLNQISIRILLGIIIGTFSLIIWLTFSKKLSKQRKKILQETIDQKKEEIKQMDTEQEPTPENLISKITKPISQKDLSRINLYIRKGETALARNNQDLAENFFIKILAINNHHKKANQHLAMLYLKIGKNQKAISIYENYLENIAQDPVVFSNLALAYYQIEKYWEAIYAYENALLLDRNKSNRFLNLGQVYYLVNEIDKAIANIKQAIKLDGKNIEAMFVLADLYLEKKEITLAIKTYQDILKVSPYNDEAKEELARLEGK